MRKTTTLYKLARGLTRPGQRLAALFLLAFATSAPALVLALGREQTKEMFPSMGPLGNWPGKGGTGISASSEATRWEQLEMRVTQAPRWW